MTVMRTQLDCIPCFLRQGLEASRFVTADLALQETIMRELLLLTAGTDLALPPVAIGAAVHRRVRELTGSPDPYRAVKSEHNKLVADVLPDLSGLLRLVPDPLVMAARLTIAANVIDLGVPGALTSDRVLASLHGALNEPFHGDAEAFATSLAGARNVLFLADNAGELVVDRLLIQEIGPDRVTLAVRGGPVINDATLADAVEAGLTDLVTVIDNGSDTPGTVLTDCSEDFRLRFEAADLVIAKGQGNYESLCGTSANAFFLFKVKCPVVARQTGLAVGTHALLPSHHRSRVPLSTSRCPSEALPRP
jgi:uncharacterized protein with ATP-grasp and redox domains